MIPSRSASTSDFLVVRGLRCHVRRWGDPAAPALFLLHGWLDVSATWQPVVEPLLSRFQVLSPDWRGFGLSEWPQDGYWFPDYVADLEVIADHYSKDRPLSLVGHSMGAQIASLFAGLRPDRVAQLVCLDGLFLPDMEPTLAPKRFRKWLDELRDPPGSRSYASFGELAGRIRKQHAELSEEAAMFVARCWGHEDAAGRITLAADPKHRLSGPGLYRAAEALAIWGEVTARTLFVDGGKSPFGKALSPEEVQRRRNAFRDHRATVVPDGTHMLHFSAPAETAAAILGFLE